MHKAAMIGAALALMLSGTAFAQTNAPAPVDTPQTAPGAEAPPPMAHPQMGPDFSFQGSGRAGWHHGWGGRGRSVGAAFRLSRGNGGPSISIKCADSDSTQECVQAIMPMLERLLPAKLGASAQ